jgi:hypothetical protein
MKDSQDAQSLTCSARIRFQADTVLQADGMPSETLAAPPALSLGERVRTDVIRYRELRKGR